MLDRIRNEPALIIGAVQAALVLGVSFGLRLTAEQTAAVLMFTAAILSVLTRQMVTGPVTAQKLKLQAEHVQE